MSERLGLLFAAALALAIGLAAASLTGVFVKPTPLVGRVLSLPGQTETERGSYAVARVRITGGEVYVTLPRTHVCVPGRVIHLSRRQMPWGPSYSSTYWPCGT